MEKYIVLAIILAVTWFVAMPFLGVPQQLTLVSIAFLVAVMFALKAIPQTSKWVSIIPVNRKIATIIAVVIFAYGLISLGWFANLTGGFNMGSIFNTANVGTGSGSTGGLDSAVTAVVYIANKQTGSAVTTNYAYRQVGTDAWTSASGSSISITANPNDKYEIVVSPDNTTTYGSLNTITIPNLYSPKFTSYVGTIATPANVKISVKNADGSVDAVSNPENMGASDKSTFPFTITGTFQNYIGNVFGGSNVVSCKYNTTAYNKVLVQDASGATLASTGTPVTLTSTTGMTYSSFVMSSITSNTPYTGQLYVEAGSTAPDANTLNITCFVEDGQIYYDSNDNTYKFGVVDEANSGLGMTATALNFTKHIS